MKKLLIILSVLLLAACDDDDQPQDRTNNYNLPESMKDCTITRLHGKKNESALDVVRCPNSQTTTISTGKGGSKVSNV